MFLCINTENKNPSKNEHGYELFFSGCLTQTCALGLKIIWKIFMTHEKNSVC